MIVDLPMASADSGISVRTLQRWIKSGRLTQRGDSKRSLIDLDELDTARLPRSARQLDKCRVLSA